MTNGDRNQVVLVDETDNVVGYEEKYAAHKNPVPLHRAISVVIYDQGRKRMLLQKRVGSKPTWPLYWSNAVCTHPMDGESYEDCAHRRLKEEFGFDTKLEEKYRFTYEADYDGEWGEHEFDVVFTGVYEDSVKPNPEEVAEYKWIDIQELEKDLQENPKLYTPWFKMIIESLG